MNLRFRRPIDRISTLVAHVAGTPPVQLAVLVASAVWLAVGGSETALASTMTIGGFVLTQMILAQQRRREKALHLKIDELIVAMEGARNELTGTELAAEDEIERLKADRLDDG